MKDKEIRITDTEDVPEIKRWMSDSDLMDAAGEETIRWEQISTYRGIVYLTIRREDYDRIVNRWFI